MQTLIYQGVSIPVRVNMIESVTHLVTDFFIYIRQISKSVKKRFD